MLLLLLLTLRRLPLTWFLPCSHCSWGVCWWLLPLPGCKNSGIMMPEERRRRRRPQPPPPCLVDRLPEEVLGSILARLAPRDAAQARMVCREWDKVVLSHPSNPVAPWCLLACTVPGSEENGTLCWAFDPNSGSWMTLPLPTAPGSRYVRFSRYSGGDSGLVGFTEHEWGAPLTHYWVGNPLTGNWRRIACLPGLADQPQSEEDAPQEEEQEQDQDSLSCSFYTINELIVDAKTGCYNVIQFCIREVADSYAWSTHVYHSKTQQWRQGAAMVHDRLFCMTSCVANGLVYFLLVGDQDAFTFKVMGYNLKKDQFEEVLGTAPVCIPEGNLSWGSFQLVAIESTENDYGKKLQLGVVAGLASGQDGGDLHLDEDFEWPLDKMCVLKFDTRAHHWVVDNKSQICIKESVPTKCSVSHVSSPVSYFYLSRHQEVNALLMYQGSRAHWSPLPDPLLYRHLLDARGCWRASIGSFVPRLDVRP